MKRITTNSIIIVYTLVFVLTINSVLCHRRHRLPKRAFTSQGNVDYDLQPDSVVKRCNSPSGGFYREGELPEKLQREEQIPETLEREEQIPETLEREEQQPETLEREEQQPETLEREEQIPETLERDEQLPAETLEREDQLPETLEREEQLPETLEREEQIPETLEREEQIPETLEQEEQLPEALEREEQIPETLERKYQLPETLEREYQLPETLEREEQLHEALEREDQLPETLEREEQLPETLERQDEPETLERNYNKPVNGLDDETLRERKGRGNYNPAEAVYEVKEPHSDELLDSYNEVPAESNLADAGVPADCLYGSHKATKLTSANSHAHLHGMSHSNIEGAAITNFDDNIGEKMFQLKYSKTGAKAATDRPMQQNPPIVYRPMAPNNQNGYPLSTRNARHMPSGDGVRILVKHRVRPRNADTDCEPDVKRCQQHKPKIWDHWSKWSDCSVTCGKGIQTRWRHCISDGCDAQEKERQTKICKIPKF